MRRAIVLLILLTGCVCNPDASYIGSEYLGARYLNDPLGEECAPDTDPLIRFDAFDCTTFVETAMAGGDVERLTKIRYKNGEIGFLNRNHFIESDWLTNNADLVENVSAQYGSTAIRTVMIDKQNWLRRIHGISAEFAPAMVNLEYIPYGELGNIHPDVPLIVLFITGNSGKSAKIGTDLAVVHMGFLLPNGMLRHASSQYGRVMDTDFNEYAAARARDKNNIGIALVKMK